MPTEITVRGSFSALQSPERGTVHATIGYEGADMQSVYDRVVRDLATARKSITALESGAPAPVTWWSAQQLRTWSHRPWNKDGRQLSLVHHASVALSVKFRDFAALSRWVGEQVAGIDGFAVNGVEWALTVARRDALAAEARTRAVRDAATRAQQYADALDLGLVRPIAIADAGMLGARPEGRSSGAFLRAAATPGGGAPEVELLPEDIEVTATIDARFVAD